MKKIRLDVESLAVESFETRAGESRAGGTVHARSAEWEKSVDWCGESVSGMHACICDSAGTPTCFKCRTDEATCGTCWQTCDLALCP